MFLTLWTVAHAADVVWLEPPSDVERAAVERAASGEVIDALTFRASKWDLSPDDSRALRALGTAVETVRPYERQLDGELLIMRDLQRPIDMVTLLRDEADRSALFAALAYQGFAVDRFWGDELAGAEEAADYRATYNGVTIPTPWRDAVALEPDRRISPYDIAEAPQRIHYAEVQQVVNEQLPVTLLPQDLPEGSELIIDGRLTRADATGAVKVPPGRHLLHVAQGGHVLQRWDVTLDPGTELIVALDVSDALYEGFIASLAEGAEVPEPIAALITARGETWFARPGATDPVVYAIDEELKVRAVRVELPRAENDERPGPAMQVAALGGWTGSHDFYYQSPEGVEASAATVNAGTIGATAGAQLGIGPFAAAAGVDLLVPLGENHTALVGATPLRIRPVPHVAFGIRQAQAAVGWAFPWHPAVGLRGAQPVVGPLELRWLAWYGIPRTVEREDATPYNYKPLGMVAGGVGLRL